MHRCVQQAMRTQDALTRPAGSQLGIACEYDHVYKSKGMQLAPEASAEIFRAEADCYMLVSFDGTTSLLQRSSTIECDACGPCMSTPGRNKFDNACCKGIIRHHNTMSRAAALRQTCLPGASSTKQSSGRPCTVLKSAHMTRAQEELCTGTPVPVHEPR